ncbi:MAG: ATP-binding protein [Hyphomonadaceae bacterium]|nr:ATP-binding protein [Hyphomonadaceae bacterium]
MLTVSREDIERRVRLDNPWWDAGAPPSPEHGYGRRVYFDPFSRLALDMTLRRATVLLGPRRVGKTVMAKQLVYEAIRTGHAPTDILYVSIDTPVYAGISLEKFLEFLPQGETGRALVIFDEIQYLRNWETHLKDLVDTYPSIKFVATGSAAAALKVKSLESGAGRFTDFVLPPLTFHEFLDFTGRDEELVEEYTEGEFRCRNIDELNAEFVNYLNYGGYPEVALSDSVRSDAGRFIKSDIIDKVLLRDLPSLYGISNIQELNRLFSMLAYNTGGEVDLQGISQISGLSKPSIQKYLTYLESAFLIIRVQTVNDTCRTLARQRNFKVYLNNPSMRSALFSPVTNDDSNRIGHLCEAAIFSQWQHSTDFSNLRYARWKDGEVDMVYLEPSIQRPYWAIEIKWSDRIKTDHRSVTDKMRHLLQKNNSIEALMVTTKSVDGEIDIEGLTLKYQPSAMHCYTVGRNVTRRKVRDMVSVVPRKAH